MTRRRRVGFWPWPLVLALLLGACVATGPKEISVAPATGEHLPHCAAAAEADRYIDLDELAHRLPPPPITVAFDVDDTVLFSSPAFYYGRWKYGNDYLDQEEFWAELNRGLDRFSIPKLVARELVGMHRSRGDRILFITARVGTRDEEVTAALMTAFRFSDPPPVIFTDRRDKAPWLEQEGVVIFYGDSDGDMRDAIAAGARPIRVIRSPLSTNPGATHPGAFGEEVIVDSEN